MASVRSKSSQTSTTPDPESALHHISQEIALLQARLMERDIARVHQVRVTCHTLCILYREVFLTGPPQ